METFLLGSKSQLMLLTDGQIQMNKWNLKSDFVLWFVTIVEGSNKVTLWRFHKDSIAPFRSALHAWAGDTLTAYFPKRSHTYRLRQTHMLRFVWFHSHTSAGYPVSSISFLANLEIWNIEPWLCFLERLQGQESLFKGAATVSQAQFIHKQYWKNE